MNGTNNTEIEQASPSPQPRSTRIYIIAAVILVAVIILAAVILITRDRDKGEEVAFTPTVEPEITLIPTFTPGPKPAPTSTPPPAVPPVPIMGNTDTPLYDFVSAGARPGTDWTGFFGQVTDAQGNPLAGVPVVIWYPDGVLAAEVVHTDKDGNYEIHLADGALAGLWSIQVLTADMQPASKLQTFRTDDNTQTGIQQIQVLWQKVP
jgi:hypothetical protein